MRAVFFGTPDFAVPSLIKLREICDVVAVVCQPDRAKDRKGRYIFSPVKQYAIDNGIPVYQFEKIRQEGVEILRKIFEPFASGYAEIDRRKITKTDLYALGLSGTDNASEKRAAVCAELGLPRDISANAMLEALNLLVSYEELEETVKRS